MDRNDKRYIGFELLEISGFTSALRALRLPFGKDVRSDVGFSFTNIDDGISTKSYNIIDDKDLKLMHTLIKRGDEHAKAIRGILVYLEIEAPRYIWSELDTYRIGTERLSSESTMHIQGKGMSEDELIEMKSNLNEGTLQKRVQYFSYQTLRRIYFQRRNHRLPQWRTFCEFIEALPYANELITFEKDEQKRD